MGYNNVYRPVIGQIKRSTDKALLLTVQNPEALTEDETEIDNWVPRSQVAKVTDLKNGTFEVMMSEWIIGQKKLEAFVVKPKSPVPQPNKVEVPEDDIPF